MSSSSIQPHEGDNKSSCFDAAVHSKWFAVALLVGSVVIGGALLAFGGAGLFVPAAVLPQFLATSIGVVGYNGCLAMFISGAAVAGVGVLSSTLLLVKASLTKRAVETKSSKTSNSIEEIKRLADHGNAAAQLILGDLYKKGEGVEQSDEEAVKRYKMAAELGNVIAQFLLGDLYKKGEGVKQSDEEAVKWYTKAADQEDANALLFLGKCYKKGEGVKQSDEESVKRYEMAAELGNATAQVIVGNCYSKGEGVEQSHEKAVKWYTKAADQGDVDAKTVLMAFF